ncbi:MAG: family 16 glycoside hydrolase [Gemmatimonadales bacterium]
MKHSLFAVATLTAGVVSAQTSSLAGRWDLVIRDRDGSFPGWLEVQSGRTPTGRLQWGWGHATPLTEIRIEGSRFRFVWPDEGNPSATPSRGEGEIRAGRLTMTMTGGDGRTYALTGRRAPSLARSPSDTARWGRPIDLLADGMAHWTARGEKNGWSVTEGILTNAPPSSDLISKLPLGDFTLHLEVNVPPDGNSGIYLRGRHEVQVLDSHGQPAGNRQMGGVYGQLTPSANAARPAGEWQTYDITLVGRRLKVVLNGVTIHEFAEIPGVTGGALDSDEGEPGPLMLQGDHTAIRYRNITVTPAIPADPRSLRGLRVSELRRFDAMMRADTSVIRPLLARELVYTHSNGQVESRERHLEVIGAKRTVYESIAPVVMQYTPYGPDLVLGSGVVKASGALNGAPFDVVLRVTTVHDWREGRWQLVTWQSTRLP